MAFFLLQFNIIYLLFLDILFFSSLFVFFVLFFSGKNIKLESGRPNNVEKEGILYLIEGKRKPWENFLVPVTRSLWMRTEK